MQSSTSACQLNTCCVAFNLFATVCCHFSPLQSLRDQYPDHTNLYENWYCAVPCQTEIANPRCSKVNSWSVGAFTTPHSSLTRPCGTVTRIERASQRGKQINIEWKIRFWLLLCGLPIHKDLQGDHMSGVWLDSTLWKYYFSKIWWDDLAIRRSY